MDHGMLESAVPTGLPGKLEKTIDKQPRGMPESIAERWITQIQGGVVTLIQRIEASAFVVSSNELPAICANAELVSNEQARAIVDAIRCRLE